MLENNLSSLGLHHHLLDELIRQANGVSASTLHERYEAVADAVYEDRELTPVNDSQRRVKVRKLRAYDLVSYTGENRHGEYVTTDADVESDVELRLPTEAV